ncbi:MAG: hypothetical protein JKY37_26355 [Nannocystaceae bacterium]|nr:hypothetical protein [Nannocystaceae bacterium]
MRTGFTALATCLLLATAAGSAQAAGSGSKTSGSGTCRAQLEDLEDKQSTLAGLQAAQAEGATRRKVLRSEAFELSVQIASLRARHASPDAIRPIEALRGDALADVRLSERLAPALATQIKALTPDVEADSRRYIACVESSL